MIQPGDVDLIAVTDDPAEVIRIVRKAGRRRAAVTAEPSAVPMGE
jgi:hypothetical protein